MRTIALLSVTRRVSPSFQRIANVKDAKATRTVEERNMRSITGISSIRYPVHASSAQARSCSSLQRKPIRLKSSIRHTPWAVRGKCRRGNVFCRAAGEQGPVPGGMRVREKPKGCLPAQFRGLSRHKAAPDESGAKVGAFRPLSSWPSLSLPKPRPLLAWVCSNHRLWL
jgi:hypothetical protein